MREGLGSRLPMATWFAPIEGKHKSFPTGARVVLYLQFLLRPLPLVRPCRARLPWRVRLWSVRPWLASPGGSGVPSVLFLPLFLPFLAFLFCLLVSGHTG